MTAQEAREKVAKLLRVAGGRANVHEAELAAKIAAELQARYQLHRAERQCRQPQPSAGAEAEQDEEPVEIVETPWTRTWTPWQRVLLEAVARLYGCGVFQGMVGVLIIGPEESVGPVQVTYAYLEREIEHSANAAWHDRGGVDAPRPFRSSFRIGAVVALFNRAGRLRKTALAHARKDLGTDDRAFARVVDLDVRVKAYCAHIGSARTANLRYDDKLGFALGKKAGSTIQLSSGFMSKPAVDRTNHSSMRGGRRTGQKAKKTRRQIKSGRRVL